MNNDGINGKGNNIRMLTSGKSLIKCIDTIFVPSRLLIIKE